MKNAKRNLKKMVFIFALSVLTSFALVNETKAQSVDANNAIYLELGGNGLIYSLNYDYRFNTDWSARAGVMYLPIEDVTLTIVPIIANYLYGNNHMLEIGAGIAYVGISFETDDDEFFSFSGSGVVGTGTFGYRYQKVDGGFVFRAGITPIFGAGGFLPWAGLSLGYAF
jgi:hypothetical protein